MRRRHPEFDEMWARFRETGDPEIRAKIIESYRYLVRHTAERLKGKLPQAIDIREMISAGTIGLIQAVDKFEPERGYLFETYCISRIRGAILDDLRAGDWVPRLIRAKAHRLERARTELAFELSREPDDEEVAGRMGLSVEEFSALLREIEVRAQLPIEGAYSDSTDDNEVLRVELLKDRSGEQPVDALALREVREVAMRGLSAKEQKIIDGYYFRNKTMKEIGKQLGISESRVCQMHGAVLKFLRQKFGGSAGYRDMRRSA